MKKTAAIILTLIFALGLAAPALAAGFSDIDDGEVFRGAETLRLLGVINGVGDGRFEPGGTLTRAAFCKMTVLIRGEGEAAESYASRTIFPDVRAGHWARGYINLMASSASPLLRGFSDGTFRPDAAVTFAQAVTILTRALGYADADAGMRWPEGYMELAKRQGLLKGLEGLEAEGPLTRAQAVSLFVNLLGAKLKDGSDFIAKLGTAKKAALFGYKDGVLSTSEGDFETVSEIPGVFLGGRGTLVLNADGLVSTVLSDGTGAGLKTALAQIEAEWLITSGGEKYEVKTGARLFVDGKEQTYSAWWVNLIKGSGAVLYFGEDGELDIICVSSPSSGSPAVIKSASPQSDISALTGGQTGYSVVKNGKAVSLSDARQYDVASYDAAAKVLTLSGVKLTGRFESAEPNTVTPRAITVLGNKFEVLDCALKALASFDIGDEITLLLTADNKVAGALPPSVYRADAIGILQSYSDGTATIKLINGMTVTGRAYYDADAGLVGELVTARSFAFSSGAALSVSKLGGADEAANLNVAARTMGGLRVGEDVAVFERVGGGKPRQIEYEDLTQDWVPASKISSVHVGGDGRVDALVLNDATGELYTYGFLYDADSDGKAIKLITASGEVSANTNYLHKSGVPSGIAVYNAEQNLVYITELKKASNIGRGAFKTGESGVTVELPAFTLPVSKNVVCYNAKSGTWFSSLDEARAFSDRLTVYYDRIPQEGGKVRLVVAE